MFSLPASAENVAIVRHAVAGLAEALGMEPTAVADLKTIVSEACTNAAVHAYSDGGPLEVHVKPDETGLTVTVRDDGSGIRPSPDLEGSNSRLRLGLPLIAALSTSFSISGAVGRGTEVVMRMDLVGAEAEEVGSVTAPALTHGTAIETGDARIAALVLGRVLGVLAARTDFAVDRLTDTMLIADALATNAAEGFEDGRLRVVVEDGDGTIDVRVGPMQDGAGERLRSDLEIPGLGTTLEKLADEVSVDQQPEGEYFSLKMGPVRP